MTERFRFSVLRNPDEFLRRCESWLLRREAEHNLILGVASAVRDTGTVPSDAYFATLELGTEIIGSALRTPPWKLIATEIPSRFLGRVTEALSSLDPDLPAVHGPDPTAKELATKWSSLTNKATSQGMRQRIFQLERVRPSKSSPPGTLRVARREESATIAEWMKEFSRETGVTPKDVSTEAQVWIREERLFVYEDETGTPQSMAGWTGATKNAARISLVYTPPDQRGKGLASATVASLSQRLLDSGRRFCVLYTDLGNPTSNRIYPRIGYVPVADVSDYDFESPPLASEDQ